MPACDIIVVGGSAGAVEAMQELVRAFPPGMPATVFMVLHLSPDFPSRLPQILGRAGPLPVRHAQDGEPIAPAQISGKPGGFEAAPRTRGAFGFFLSGM